MASEADKVLYCIRHGESTFNEWRKRSIMNFTWIFVRDPMIIDAPLSAKGEQQARALHDAMQRDAKTNEIQVVVTSPLTRAIQTALGVFKDAPMPIILEASCREMLDTACDIGRQPEALANEFHSAFLHFDTLTPYWWLPEHQRPPNSTMAMEPPTKYSDVVPLRESNADVDARIQSFVRKLAKLPQQHIAIVGHSSFLKRMLGMNRKLHNCELYVVPFRDVLARYPVA